MCWRDYSVQASGSSFPPPAGQSCPVTHRSAAFTQESRGEATAGTVVPHHTLQPAEPHAAALASVQWGGGCRQLQQPSWGHTTAELQQGKHTECCSLASRSQGQMDPGYFGVRLLMWSCWRSWLSWWHSLPKITEFWVIQWYAWAAVTLKRFSRYSLSEPWRQSRHMVPVPVDAFSQWVFCILSLSRPWISCSKMPL